MLFLINYVTIKKNHYIHAICFLFWSERMQWNKKTIMMVGLAGGIMLFFIGMVAYIILGPSTDTYIMPRQISSLLKLTGMGIVCISMIVGGFFAEKIEKDTKILLLLFGMILLLLNIFLFSSSQFY
jgi:hypothetical protein